MLVIVGSTNEIKVGAVEQTLVDYPTFTGFHVMGVSVPSGVSEQPLTLDEIVQGASNRASHAFKAHPQCCYSFGIESGIFPVKGTRTGFFEACVCAIYDGCRFYFGLSSGFEVPPAILHHVLHDGADLGVACHLAGITDNPRLGSSEGLVGILTSGRMNRLAYTKQSLVTALVQLEHATWYKDSKR